jgi:hypothetical protein
MITQQRASEFGIEQQREGESIQAFRERVAEQLRRAGHIIEAHEALTDKLYDDPDNELGMAGIIGAVAKTMQDRHYGGSEVASDIAAGVTVQQPPMEDGLAAMLMLIMAGL